MFFERVYVCPFLWHALHPERLDVIIWHTICHYYLLLQRQQKYINSENFNCLADTVPEIQHCDRQQILRNAIPFLWFGYGPQNNINQRTHLNQTNPQQIGIIYLDADITCVENQQWYQSLNMHLPVTLQIDNSSKCQVTTFCLMSGGFVTTTQQHSSVAKVLSILKRWWG